MLAWLYSTELISICLYVMYCDVFLIHIQIVYCKFRLFQSGTVCVSEESRLWN